jgi:hypothetical protein
MRAIIRSISRCSIIKGPIGIIDFKPPSTVLRQFQDRIHHLIEYVGDWQGILVGNIRASDIAFQHHFRFNAQAPKKSRPCFFQRLPLPLMTRIVFLIRLSRSLIPLSRLCDLLVWMFHRESRNKFRV